MDINTCFATTADLRTLALYANFAPAAASILLAGFVLFKSANRKTVLAFTSFVGVFSLWLIAAGIIWTSNDYYLVAALWTPIDYFALLFFLLIFCFFYLDIFDSIPLWLNIVILAVASVSFAINLLGQGAFGFDQPWCNMNNNEFLTVYNLWVGLVILLAILGLGIYKFLRTKTNHNERVRVGIVTGSIVLFLGIFLGSEYWSSVTSVYTTELYALFTLPIFILFLTVAITSYGTFRLGDTVAKMLFYIFLVFSGAEFFFVTTPASIALAVVAFLMTLSFGLLLLQSYERETRIRTEVEKLARELAVTNERQEGLIHFIGHEVKGFLTKDSGTFASLSEGDFGVLPETAKRITDEALAETRRGVDSVSTILKAANLKRGTVTYERATFDLGVLVAGATDKARFVAEKKGLALSLDIAPGQYEMVGDKAQIADHVLRNLLDNAVNYTPTGSISVSLVREKGKFIFAVEDTGVGITEADKQRLFTEGGHGKDSQKVNAHSTGYGLYIAKQIIEAHNGNIRCESAGEGKGSIFIVEFPAN